MCGIIGFVTKRASITSPRRSNFMEQGLYVNALRGQHATGMFYGDVEETVWWAKDAVDARTFLSTQNYAKLVGDMDKDVTFCVGHNRFATMGEHTQADAHPFFQGEVTMVHNGTLRSYKSLGTPKEGTSDSAHICAALAAAEPGDIDVLEKLDGDFALVWHDRRDNALRVATNGRRPLSYLIDLDNLYFASEEGMLQMLVNRVTSGVDKAHEVFHFTPYHMYTLQIGADELVWTSKEFEDSWTTLGAYTNHNRGHNMSRNPYTWEDSYDYDGWDTQHELPFKKDKPATNVLQFPTESKAGVDTRVAGCNRLMRDWGMDVRAGDSIFMDIEASRAYAVKENTDAPVGERKGQAEGFFYSHDSKGGSCAFYCTVHQCPMLAVGEYTDTVKGQLANAYVDQDGDLHLVLIFQERGAYRVPVSHGCRPAVLDKFFKGDRWYYNKDDGPRFSWVDNTHSLSAREVDLLLDGQFCEMESCHIPHHMVPRLDIIFTEEQKFVCRDCTAHSVEMVDGHVQVKAEPKQTTKQRMRKEAKEDQAAARKAAEEAVNIGQKRLVYDAAGKVTEEVVDMVEDPPGSKKFVLCLPKRGKKPLAYVDAYGQWREKGTDKPILDADGKEIHVTH